MKAMSPGRIMAIPEDKFEELTIRLDPDWSVFKRYGCGHFMFACCLDHLEDLCQVCNPPKEVVSDHPIILSIESPNKEEV